MYFYINNVIMTSKIDYIIIMKSILFDIEFHLLIRKCTI